MFDAAHQRGIIAGKESTNPLNEGGNFMTMSTYKSLGGPAGGLIVSNDKEIAKRFNSFACQGMTANFDVTKSAALSITMLDRRDFGAAFAAEMIEISNVLVKALDNAGIPVFSGTEYFTKSHQFVLCAEPFGGGQRSSKTLRNAVFFRNWTTDCCGG